MRVDLVATRPHYLEHAALVWREFSADERGSVVVPTYLRERAVELVGKWDDDAPTGDVRLAAGWVDAQGPPHQKRVLMEHGVGQRYEGVHLPNYVGGKGREVLDLALLPNDDAQRWERCESVVVGSPYLDHLRRIEHSPVFDVAFSFHFDSEHLPEMGGGFRWFRGGVLAARDSGMTILGHAHPRNDNAFAWYAAHDLMHTTSFEVVVASSRVYACDNSSTMFYAAALGLPVVVMNPPQYRRGVHHGIRFWDCADVGRQVSTPDELHHAVQLALSDPENDATERSRVAARLFPLDDGKAAERCVNAIRSRFAS